MNGLPGVGQGPSYAQKVSSEQIPDDKKHDDFMSAVVKRAQHMAKERGIAGVSVRFAYTVAKDADGKPVTQNVTVDINPAPSDAEGKKKIQDYKLALLGFIREEAEKLPPDRRERGRSTTI